MRMTLGRVAADGRIVIVGEPLPEGSQVTVLAPEEDDGGVLLTSEEEEELLAAMVEGAAGDYVSGEEVLAQLRRPR